jgi:DNA repair protein RadA/Sms
MKKSKINYVCSDCGQDFPKWVGICTSCGSGDVKEFKEAKNKVNNSSGYAGGQGKAEVLSIDEIGLEEKSRINTGIGELDRVLGGGLVTDSVIMITGGPGIGKSTMLIDMSAKISVNTRVLYVTGEESLSQVSSRGKRLKLDMSAVRFLTETCVENIIEAASREKSQLIIIDSIQTMYSLQIDGESGSVSQLKACTKILNSFAKIKGAALILVGHITKDGSVAGPKVLEHIVDVSLHIEGESNGKYRMLRSNKNRFGETSEVGVFAMTSTGMKEIKNPSRIFLSSTEKEHQGSVVTVTQDGTRSQLFELQSLVNECRGEKPMLVTAGVHYNKIQLLSAIIKKHLQINFFHDIYISVVGGINIQQAETAIDLAIIASLLSSYEGKVISNNVCIFGEVGLTGEIRPVPNGQERVMEAKNHGFDTVIIPKANKPSAAVLKDTSFNVIMVEDILEFYNVLSNNIFK